MSDVIPRERLSDAQVKALRARALRDYRRIQRKADTQIEKIERLVFQALDNKKMISIDYPWKLAVLNRGLVRDVNAMLRSLADMFIVFSD